MINPNRHPLCIGLDPDLAKIPPHLKTGDTTNPGVALDFCRRIVDATAEALPDWRGWYKANFGFFVRLGGQGLDNLCRLREHVHAAIPGVSFILDSKSCDIGNSMEQYVATAFDLVGADGMTANPYAGQDACQPLLDRRDKLGIYLCKTSNPKSGETQNVRMLVDDPDEHAFFEERGCAMIQVMGNMQAVVSYYAHIAYLVSQRWNQHGNCGLVVGATYPTEILAVRKIVGDGVMILAPGIGKQGGDLKATVKHGINKHGQGLAVNVGTSILFASSQEDFKEAAADAAKCYRLEIDDQLATA